jgi:hypothetical protein
MVEELYGAYGMRRAKFDTLRGHTHMSNTSTHTHKKHTAATATTAMMMLVVYL